MIVVEKRLGERGYVATRATDVLVIGYLPLEQMNAIAIVYHCFCRVLAAKLAKIIYTTTVRDVEFCL